MPVELQTVFRHCVAVFSGRTIRVEESRVRGYNGILATILVLESWKGAHVGQIVTVATGHGEGDCGVEFATGKKYLVFAGLIPRKGWLSTNICANTGQLDPRWHAVDSLRTWKARGWMPPDPPRPRKRLRP